MRRHILNIARLGVKELYSLRRDPVLLFLIIYTFTFAVYTVATGVRTEVRNAAIAIVDEDQSELSRQLTGAFLQPYFKTPAVIRNAQIDDMMDSGRFSFVVDVPPKFEADVLAGRNPAVQVNVDATAMTVAGIGTTYIHNIIKQELDRFIAMGDNGFQNTPVNVVVRSKFNLNLDSKWFISVMQIVNNVTMLALILSGAAVIREREHGTTEHLLVMPLTPTEIVLSKIWANGLVIVLAAIASVYVVVKGVLGVTINGSIGLFAVGTSFFLFAMAALGITLSTVARSMPQFGLLAIPFFVVMNMLSGGISPQEAMPPALQLIMQFVPSTHFTSLAQAVLYRGAGLDVVWPQLLAMAAAGGILLTIALVRFRAAMAEAQ